MENMTLFDFELKDYQGNEIPMDVPKKHILINVASQCGYTKNNYQELKQFLETVNRDNFNVYLFPCDDFGGQEPGTMDEIKTFCDGFEVLMYPNVYLMDKVVLKDSPLWHWLQYTNEWVTKYGWDFEVKWNFHKYFVDENGEFWGFSYSYENLNDEAVVEWVNTPIVTKEEQEEILTEMMRMDQELGLYDEPIEIEGEIIGYVKKDEK